MHIKSRSETKLVHLKKTTNFYCQKFIFFSVLMETKELNPHQICIYLANLKISNFFSLVQYEHCVYDGYHCHNRLRTLIKEL